MNKAFIFLILLYVMTTASFSYSQDVSREPRCKITQLNPGLWEITIASVNVIASAGSDGILIVDANYSEYARFLEKAIDSIGGGKKLNYIVDTHWHFDHTGGQKIFGMGTKIISHKNVKELLSKDDILLGDTQKAYPDYALPNITFSDSLALKFNDSDIIIKSVSGSHSAGDAVVYFRKEKVLHIGDIIFADEFPFVDTEHGGSVIRILESLNKIISTYPSDTKLVPGHGRIYSISDLKEYAGMVERTIGIVRKEKQKGKSLTEIQNGNALDEYKEYAVSFSCSDWIEYIYKSLD